MPFSFPNKPHRCAACGGEFTPSEHKVPSLWRRMVYTYYAVMAFFMAWSVIAIIAGWFNSAEMEEWTTNGLGGYIIHSMKLMGWWGAIVPLMLAGGYIVHIWQPDETNHVIPSNSPWYKPIDHCIHCQQGPCYPEGTPAFNKIAARHSDRNEKGGGSPGPP